MPADRMTVLSSMMGQGVIPVFYHPDVEVCRNVIQACADGGAKCIEFTNRGDFADEVFRELRITSYNVCYTKLLRNLMDLNFKEQTIVGSRVYTKREFEMSVRYAEMLSGA